MAKRRRKLQGASISHEDAEGIAYVGIRVEPAVRLWRKVEGAKNMSPCLLT